MNRPLTNEKQMNQLFQWENQLWLLEVDLAGRKSDRTQLTSTSLINRIKRTHAKQQQNTDSSQAYMEHSPKQTTFWAMKHNFKKMENTVCTLRDSGMKQDIRNRNLAGKFQFAWRLKTSSTSK